MRRALEGLEGVQRSKLRFEDREFDVKYDPAKVDAKKMIEAVKGVGFDSVVKEESGEGK
ncbi:MAG: hypothetical protein ACYTFG_05165 [Planctomycetota bacterium]